MQKINRAIKLISLTLALLLLLQALPFGSITAYAAAPELNAEDGYDFQIPTASNNGANADIPDTFIKESTSFNSEYVPTAEDAAFDRILNVYEFFSDLNGADKAFLCTYSGFSETDFAAAEENGLPLTDSINYLRLMEICGCTLEEALTAAPDEEALEVLLPQAELLCMAAENTTWLPLELEAMLEQILAGYSCEAVIRAYAQAVVTGRSLASILGGEDESLSGSGTGSLTAPTAGQTDLEQQIENQISMWFSSGEEPGDAINAVTETDESDIHADALNAPFLYNSSDTEKVSLNSGALTVEYQDYVLPGVNGLDLVIGRRYNSSEAETHVPGIKSIGGNKPVYYVRSIQIGYTYYYSGRWVAAPQYNRNLQYGPFLTQAEAEALVQEIPSEYYETVNGVNVKYICSLTQFYSTTTYSPTKVFRRTENTYLNNLYGLGLGWEFCFSSIDTTSSGNEYVRLADGRTLYVQSWYRNTAVFKDYTADDIILQRNFNGYESSGVGGRFCITYKNGRQEYFGPTGNLLGIKDRFGNLIRFSRMTYNGYPKIVITDTLNRTVTITGQNVSGGHRMTVTLPDNSTLQYMVAHDPDNAVIKSLSSFTDTMGTVTNYSYTVENGSYYNAKSTSAPGTAPIQYVNLTTITHPTNAQTVFAYEPVTRNLSYYGLVEEYRLTSRSDLVNSNTYNTQTYTYSVNEYSGRPNKNEPTVLGAYYTYWTKVTNSEGLETVYTFGSSHTLSNTTTSVSGDTLQSVDYTYNSDKFPTEAVTRTYNSLGLYMETIEAAEYDSKGNVTASWSTLAEGDTTDTEHKTICTYDSNYSLLLTKTYKADANTVVLLQNTLSSDEKSIASTQIYDNSTLKQQTDYSYDSYGNMLSKTEYISFGAAPETAVTQYSYLSNAYLSAETHTGMKDSAGQSIADVVTAYTYDSLGRMVGSTDGNGNTTAFAYDAKGNLTQITNPDNTTVTYTRSYTSNYVIVTDENGNAVKYTYTPLGLEYETLDVASGLVISHREYDGLSRLAALDEYVYGSETLYTYDVLNRPLTETVYQGSTILAQTSYAYDDAYNSQYNKVTKTVLGDLTAPSIVTTQYTDKHGNAVQTGKYLGGVEYLDTFTYDYAGRQLTGLSAADAAKNLPYTVQYEYDCAGQITKQYNALGQYTTNTYDARGLLVQSTDYAGTPTTFAYDALSRLLTQTITITATSTATTKYDYDGNGNVIREQTPAHAVGSTELWTKTEYSYDSRNRLSTANQYDGTTVATSTAYTYDGTGNTLSVTTGGGAVTSYTYDRFGHVLTMTDALNQTESYSYGSLGRLEVKTDRNGTEFSYACDALGRTVSITADDGTDTEVVNCAYTLTGQKASEENQWQRTEYAYDALGRTTAETDWIFENNGSIIVSKSYAYDLAGNRTGFTLAYDGVTVQSVSYAYDALNRLYTVSEGGVTEATHTYDVNGNRASLTYANGNITAYTYNLANWVTSVTNGGGAGTISAFSYSYYASGSQHTKTDHNNVTTTYTYDGLNRLTCESESGGVTLTYTYDAAGNRTSLTATGTEAYTVAYTYDLNNRLLSETKTAGGIAEATSYTYDANGSQLSRTTGAAVLTYAYDLFDRQTEVHTPTQIIQYAYNASGLRTEKRIGTNATRFLLDGANVAAEVNGSSAVTYLRGLNLLKRDSGSAESYYLFNAHGDVVNLTDASGASTKSYNYDAFGVEKNAASYDANPFRYCGEYYDTETETYYLRARYYSPAGGRFQQEDAHWNPANMIYGDTPQRINERQDKLGLSYYACMPQISAIRQAGNLYAYCSGNPVFYSDPNGSIAITTLILLGSIAVGLIAAGTTAYQSNKYTGQIDWENTITAGLSWFCLAYTFGMSAYGVYLSYCSYRGVTPVSEIHFNGNAAVSVPNGTWQATNEHMSAASRRYQTKITGHTGEAYVVNGVKFDGVSSDGSLIEVKGDYSHFVDKSTGCFYSWFTGTESLINQATRQVSAAGGAPIDWYFSDYSSMKAMQRLFEKNNIFGLNYIHKPL